MRVSGPAPAGGRREVEDLDEHDEQDGQHDAAHELGYDGEREAGHGDDAVGDAVAAQGGRHSQHDRQRDDDDQCHEGELDRVPRGAAW